MAAEAFMPPRPFGQHTAAPACDLDGPADRRLRRRFRRAVLPALAMLASAASSAALGCDLIDFREPGGRTFAVSAAVMAEGGVWLERGLVLAFRRLADGTTAVGVKHRDGNTMHHAVTLSADPSAPCADGTRPEASLRPLPEGPAEHAGSAEPGG